MPTRKHTSRQTDAKSFREFVPRMKPVDRALESFIAHLKSEPLPHVTSWKEVRAYLNRSGAEHDAFVGGRAAWREYASKSGRDVT
jgi:hypothetical protein